MVSCFWLCVQCMSRATRSTVNDFSAWFCLLYEEISTHQHWRAFAWTCLCVVCSVPSTRRVHFNWSTAHVRRAPFFDCIRRHTIQRALHAYTHSTWWTRIRATLHSSTVCLQCCARESLRWRIAIDEHTRTVRRTHALFTPTPSRRHYTPRPFTMATTLCDSKERRKNVFFFFFRFSIYSFSALASASAHSSCPSSSSFCSF